ncbi:zinc-binding alcohol dehydrogenase family protein [Streptomonospora sp. S1-112]|uniref:Zinc-binding alcohol dehydrogenase family protein n=1 Tax=Streptomonospora mangrovi TaxID=2883123 RepID=A0A9X3SGK0_9ACTN|nr:zinc-binding alcohol dehydrogenase family protein [Streptomonospora mangrovi]MDA0564239.1 zinc-binding alcohol dehydrogenase family protein [Streptomonospora mangrovi]
MADTVLAARVTGPDRALRVEEVARRPPAAGEAAVDMVYAAVNPLDTYVLAGQVAGDAPVPRTLGVEGVGRCGGDLFAVHGAGVGLVRDGVWSTRAVVPRAALVPVPEGVDPAQAACAAVCGRTAVRVVRDLARVGADDRVLVLGAAGGVGTAAVSLAVSAGAAVWGQTGVPEKAGAITALGADPVVARTPAELLAAAADLGATVVLDPLGGDFTAAAARLLAPYGTLALYGASFAPETRLDVRSFYRGNLRLIGYGGVLESQDDVRTGIRAALRALADGTMRLRVGELTPLAGLPEALAPDRRRAVPGKTVVAFDTS